MADIKRNVRDSAYVALGACALGLSQISKNREKIATQIKCVSEQITPKINTATENISCTISNSVTLIANTVYSQVKKQSETAVNTTKKKRIRISTTRNLILWTQIKTKIIRLLKMITMGIAKPKLKKEQKGRELKANCKILSSANR